MQNITIKDVAERAGVSTGLVSMVLNNRKGVNKQTADKVMRVVEEMNYRPNKAAAALRKGYNKTIGVITPDLSNHYFSDISRHIENIAFQNGFTVLFGSSDDRKDKIGKLIDIFYADGIKGVLLTPSDDCLPEIYRAMQLGMSIVLMNRNPAGFENIGSVVLDNPKAVRLGLEHFVEQGYLHVEMISNNVTLSTLNVREKAYKSIMAELGFSDVARINFVDEKNITELDKTILDAYKRGTDAIMIPRGYLALHVNGSIKRLGLRIPEDIAIIGFDGGEAYKIMTPSITQLVQSTRETAEEAYKMLCELMEGSEEYHVVLEPELIVGDSTKKRV